MRAVGTSNTAGYNVGQLNPEQGTPAEAASAQIRFSAESKPKYEAIGMLKTAGMYKDIVDAVNGVRVPYMSEEERQAYLITFDDGKLYRGGSRLNTFDEANPNGAYLFVMDTQGKFFAASRAEVQHHSAFFSGQPVAAAGMMQVVDGELRMLTDESGHYKAPLEYTEQAVTELKNQKVDIDATEKDFIGHSKKSLKAAMKKNNFEPNERLYPYEVKKKYY